MKLWKVFIILCFIMFFTYAFYNASKNYSERQIILNETYRSEINGVVSEITYDRKRDLLITEKGQYRFMLINPKTMNAIDGYEVIQKNDSVNKNKFSDTLFVYYKGKLKSFWILDNPNN